MNDSLYEEYMRSVLGYEPIDNRNTYNMMNNDNYTPMSNITGFSNIQNEELEECYPDIYRLVYPMVQKACVQNTRPMTRELIDNMTEEIYFAIEDNEVSEMRDKNSNETKTLEAKQENRQRIVKNRGLNDLIRILLLRELLGRPGFPGGRPPRPRPPRPPMRPPMGPGPRTPFNRQSYEMFDNGYDIFEY